METGTRSFIALGTFSQLMCQLTKTVCFISCKYSSFFSTKAKSFYINIWMKSFEVPVICFHISLEVRVLTIGWWTWEGSRAQTQASQVSVWPEDARCDCPCLLGVKGLSGTARSPYSIHIGKHSGFLPTVWTLALCLPTSSDEGLIMTVASTESHSDMRGHSGQFPEVLFFPGNLRFRSHFGS